MNALILSGSFSPGARSTPDETSTPSAFELGDGALDIGRVEPARKQPRPSRRKAARKSPVEGDPVAAGQHRRLRRLGVDEQHIRRTDVALRDGKILSLRNAERLHRQLAIARADGLDPLRGFAPVKLDNIGGQRVENPIERGIVGVHRQRHEPRPPSRHVA